MTTATPELVERIGSLYVDEGQTQRQIGAAIGRSHTYVVKLMRAHGIPVRGRIVTADMSDSERLTDLMDRCAEVDGCWVWTGALSAKGYGVVSHLGRTWGVHCLVYTLMVAPIPEGLELDHLCRNPPCCNPEHLEPVTRAVNLDRQRQAAAVP